MHPCPVDGCGWHFVFGRDQIERLLPTPAVLDDAGGTLFLLLAGTSTTLDGGPKVVNDHQQAGGGTGWMA